MKTLQAKMIFFFTLFVGIVLISSQLASYLLATTQAEKHVDRETKAIVHDVTQFVENELHNVNMDLQQYAKSDLIHRIFETENIDEAKGKLVDDFQLYAKLHASVESIYVGTKGGETLTSLNTWSNQGPGYNPIEKEWYTEGVKEGGNVWRSQPYKDTVTGNMVITNSIAVHSPTTGDVVGVVAVDLSVDYFKQIMKSMNIAYGGQGFILSNNHIAFTYPGKDGEDLSGDPHVQQMNAMDGSFEGTLEEEKVKYYYAGTPLGWTVGVVYPINELMAEAVEFRTISILMFVASVVVTIIIVYVIARRISIPIRRLRNGVCKVAEGDLTVQLERAKSQELNQLTTAFNDMVVQMRNMVGAIQTNVVTVQDVSKKVSVSAQETISSSKEVAGAMESVAGHATKQAYEIEGIMIQIDNMADSITDVNTSMLSMSEMSTKAEGASRAGREKLHGLRNASSESNMKLTEAERVVAELVERVEMISEVISSIRTISDQTNLLALNASIEAARAGDHGKGFAVVAQEVRKLAEQSKLATDNVSETIKGIQEETKRAVEAMKGTRNMMDEQGKSVTNAESAFLEITSIAEVLGESIGDVTKAMKTIAEEQEHFVEIVHVFSGGSQEVASSSEEVQASTDEQLRHLQHVVETLDDLTEESNNLSETVQHFKI
ncbi:methyl-accepting chemotaxis protein [Priestia taiwanensis]|uniref:Methyl-accepting chemotaxis protein n=1 Tax=Priestia taiwanensis TaxID=1347902 RepID=A0A917ARV5_9BACI|nr:methyl-accepting chemotaxis protein [Priestia taiwanensis]MBM7363848.1 methyl-accepting chemotaxis protein [Priestia taiwanensis]GGE69478.1 methyl-accepting chemotaxis protein [Priestia taiwanensis]